MVILSPNTVMCAYSGSMSDLMLQGFQICIALLVFGILFIIPYHVIPRRNWTRHVTAWCLCFLLQFLKSQLLKICTTVCLCLLVHVCWCLVAS